MKEAIGIFQTIVQTKWFRNTPVILFLNKVDAAPLIGSAEMNEG